MSILDTLNEQGLTQEDLEKAASARLFAEAAAAEGIDLSELTEAQAEELYDFWANNAAASEKDASANAFFEAAAAEGIDLNELTEDQVGELYNFWANGGEEVEKSASAEDLLAEAAVKEASAKLAEAEYIGRYMARVYADELNKLAADDGPSIGDRVRGAGSAVHGAMGTLGEKASFGKLTGGKAKALGYGLTAAGTAGAAYGGKKLHDRMKSKGEEGEKQSSIDALIEERALELLKEAADEEAKKSVMDRLRGAGKAVHSGMGTLGEKASFGKLTGGKAKALGYGLTAAGTAGAAYGAKKLLGKKKPSDPAQIAEKQSSIDELIEERALELLKEAAEEESKKSVMDRIRGAGKAVHSGMGTLGEKASFGKLTGGKAKALGYGITAAGTAGAAYGGKKLHDRMKAKHEGEKQSSIDELIEARALEMLEEAEISSAIDEAALELLAENGFIE
jgi:hypothetical protein